MKWLVRDNDTELILDEFNSKKDAEKYVNACKERDAEKGFYSDYSILLRAGNQL